MGVGAGEDEDEEAAGAVAEDRVGLLPTPLPTLRQICRLRPRPRPRLRPTRRRRSAIYKRSRLVSPTTTTTTTTTATTATTTTTTTVDTTNNKKNPQRGPRLRTRLRIPQRKFRSPTLRHPTLIRPLASATWRRSRLAGLRLTNSTEMRTIVDVHLYYSFFHHVRCCRSMTRIYISQFKVTKLRPSLMLKAFHRINTMAILSQDAPMTVFHGY